MNINRCLLFLFPVAAALLLPNARAASCKTQSEMTATQRDSLSSTARSLIADVQNGDLQALRTNTIPAVAANFSGIAASAGALKPAIQHAAITIDTLYSLDASSQTAGAPQTQFFCGNPVVVLTFNSLPPARYALAIVHATGVPQPQQVSLILSAPSGDHWMLAGFFSSPMLLAGHNGLWYWEQARDYAQRKLNWNAWLYYQAAAPLLDPLPFLSSPNIQKLQHEADSVRPADFPGVKPLVISAQESTFSVTGLSITGELGGMDLEADYNPDPTQLTQLRDPVAARKQAVDLMVALLTAHPELRLAFRGIWARAESGNASVYALDLPMGQIPATAQATPVSAQTQPPTQRGTTIYDPTKPQPQPNLTLDHDPVLSPDAADNAAIGPAAPASTGPARSGEIQKGKGGMYTLLENVNEVVQYCTVVDEKGNLVNGLTRGDFRVWEDGVPQTIDAFQHQDIPVSMGILVDNSGSMRDKRAAVATAALELVRASNRGDAAFIVNFSDRAYLDQGFTSNIAALRQGLSHFDSANMTALYDAVVASADELSRHARQPKQVLLIITDGADNGSRLTLAQAVHRVQRLGGPVVYSIGLIYGDDKAEAEQAKSDLETLSRETGGIAYFPASLQDVNEVAEQVARDIRDQYTIGYHSTKPASLGGYRRVHVEAEGPNHRKLIVRTRTGYYPNTAARHATTGKAVQAAQVAQ